MFIFRATWMKVGKDNKHNNLLDECQLQENQRTESHTLLWGINKFLPALSVLIVQAAYLNKMLFNICGFRQIGAGKIVLSLEA